MIANVHSRSIIADINTTAGTILQVLSAYSFTEDAYLTGLITRLTHTNQKLTEANKEVGYTSNLSPIDKKRGQCFQALFYEVKAKRRWPDAQIQEAANHIYRVIENYGLRTIHMAYAEESACINALLSDLSEPELQPSIDALVGFRQLIEQLQVHQTEFQAAYLQGIEQKVEEDQEQSASKISVDLRLQINKELVPYVNTMAKVRPEEFKDLADQLAVIVEDNNRRVRQRLKRTEEPENVNEQNDSEQEV